MKKVMVVVVGLSLASAVPALAFDVGGYRTGMTYAEARSVARSQGLDLYPFSNVGESYRVGRPDPQDVRYSIAFCHGGLSFLSENLAGGFHAFATQVSAFQNQFGSGLSSGRSEYTANGHVSQVVVTFLVGNDERKTVSAVVIDNFPAPSVSVSHYALIGACPQ